jgi:hypothetical protein
MDAWNTDRIYTWFGSAPGNNESNNRKFYFDFSDNTFFDLMQNDNKYSVNDKITLNAEDKTLLLSKNDKIKKTTTQLYLKYKNQKERYLIYLIKLLLMKII